AWPPPSPILLLTRPATMLLLAARTVLLPCKRLSMRVFPMYRSLPWLVLLCSMMMLSGGCRRTPVAVTSNEPPTLPVSKPVQREVTDYGEFTGRTVAVNSVDVRPRVTGYLTKMEYREGSEVKK